HLVIPQTPFRIEGNTERIAMTERPDLRGHAALVRERIVLRHRTVVVEPYDLAEIRLHVLCRIELLTLAGGDPQISVLVERDAVTVVPAARHLRHLAPDHLQIFQRPAALVRQLEPRARDRGTARVAI